MKPITEDFTLWLGQLKPGDQVGVYERYGAVFLFERTVERRTPSGRVVCEGGSVFKADGTYNVARTSPYADRCIKPLPTNTSGSED